MKKRILAYARNRKGVSLVMMAILLALLLILASLAIDIAYMYFVKNQLQVAADAAALAGAAKLDGSASLIQEPARRAAWQIACKNTAANSKVFLVTNSPSDCDTNSPPDANQLNADTSTDRNRDINGDIVIGFWNGSSFSPTVDPSQGQIANAVKVVARRSETGATYGMPQVNLFLGKIFKFFQNWGIDWSKMSVAASAIAARPPIPSTGLVLCEPACSLSGAQLDIPFLANNQQSSAEYSLSYTEFSLRTPVGKTTCLRNPNKCDRGLDDDCRTNAQKAVASYIWQLNIAPTRCGTIRWDNGVGNIPSDIECAFRSTTVDANSKTIVNGQTVNWKVIVPISETCPSGSTPGQTDVSNIIKLAEIVIVDVVDAQGRSVIYGSAASPAGIKISSINCFPCDDWTHISLRPTLVK